MQATIEIFWLNAITYRTEIRSPGFRQTRIVNGNVVEEHNSGDYYPRWIQDFLAGILNPVPEATRLRRVPGEVPIGLSSEACISTSTSDASPDTAQLCFRNAEPRIAGITDIHRSLWFDDYAPFGSQQIPHTIVDNLQPNLLVRGHIVRLEPLAHSFYRLLKATRFTSSQEQLATSTVSTATAQTLLQLPTALYARRYIVYIGRPTSQTPSPDLTEAASAETASSENHPTLEQTPIYIRTDRAGRVREAYRSPSDHYGAEQAALVRAFTLHFKPLIVDGAPRQMEALVYLPADSEIDSEINARWPQSRPAQRWSSIARSNPGSADSTRPSHAHPASPETQTQTPAAATAPQIAAPDQATVPAPPPPDKQNQ